MLLYGFLDRLTGKNKEAWKEGRIRGTAVLVKRDVLDVGDFYASVLDGAHKILGKDDGVAFHLVSATAPDPSKPPPPPSSSPSCIAGLPTLFSSSCHLHSSVCLRALVESKKKKVHRSLPSLLSTHP